MSIHHVGIEVPAAEVERAAQLFETLGFARVEPPPSLALFTWLEREGTQIHLMPEERPAASRQAHLALIVPDFERSVERLRSQGFAVEPRRAHWGSPRCLVRAPGGARVELMQFPPAAASSGPPS